MDEKWEPFLKTNQWEYLTLPMHDKVAAFNVLNDYGKGGWELVTVLGPVDGVQVAYLKRKLG